MMDAFIEQTSEELEKCQQKLLASEDALRETEEKLKSREEELRASEEVHDDMKDTLRESEEELRSSQEALGDMKVQMRETSEALEETLTTVSHLETKLTRLRGVLRTTWQEGDQIAAHLAERRLRSEDDTSRTQQDQKTELSSFKEFARKLQQDHTTLAEELKEERAVVCSLSVLLQQEKSESAERMRDFEDEMEEVLGELEAMQGQEQRWRDTLAEHHATLLSLGRDHAKMETELNETRALLECKRRCEMNHHSMALESLQEEHTYSQHMRGEHQASFGTSKGQEDHITRGHAKDPYTP